MENTVATKILDIFLSNRYRRGSHQQSETLLSSLTTFIEKGAPIELVGFWGVGPKDIPNWADQESCAFLHTLSVEIQRIYQPSLGFTFIFADMHGQHNGYDSERISSYIQGIKLLFENYGFRFCFLSDLWQKYDLSFERIEREWQSQPNGWWERIENHGLIENNARHRNIHSDPVEAAQKYYVMRNLEKPILEKEFGGSVFHAFSDPKLANVLPNMPTLYFYARPGWSDTPWFVTAKEKS